MDYICSGVPIAKIHDPSDSGVDDGPRKGVWCRLAY